MRSFRFHAPLIVLTGFYALLSISARANNIQVTNPTLTGNTGTTVLVQFDVTWENSWRGGAVTNWDAAWIFVKWKTLGNVWNHVHPNNTGFTAPAGSQIDMGLRSPGVAYDATTNPVDGIFIYRSANGNGTFAANGVQLLWNYAAAGITFNDITKIDVFGIEMVYVPQGAFYLGDGAGASINDVIAGQFAQGNTNNPFPIISEAALTLGGTSIANLGNHNGVGGYTDDFNATTTQVLPAAFPKGYKAFYCMKYEISQGQMADFFNALTYVQQYHFALVFEGVNPNDPLPNGGTACEILVLSIGIPNAVPAQFGFAGSGAYRAFDVASGEFASANGLFLAYLDWCGQRPMSELEYEKACRGPLTPLDGEYAWGTTTIATTPYTLSNAGTATEGIATNYSTTSGNALYASTTPGYTNVRAGIFAANAANTGRVTAGATYYGIMEMSGNVIESAVFVSSPTSRAFTGAHGNGDILVTGEADVAGWVYLVPRGGRRLYGSDALRVSDRSSTGPYVGSGRGVHTAP